MQKTPAVGLQKPKQDHFIFFFFEVTIFPQSFQQQRQVYSHLKPLETEAFEPAEAFLCCSTITGTQRCLGAPELGEARSLHRIPLSMAR